MDRRWRFLVVLVVALALPIVVAESAYADPAIDVPDGTALLDYDTVTLTASGFTPGTIVGYCEAIDDGDPDPTDCAVGTQAGGIFTGPFTVSIDVRRTFTTASGIAVDCSAAATSCAVAAADINDIAGTAVSTPITFATPPAPPATTGAIVLPDTQPYGNGQPVTVDGSGFRSGAEMVLLQCAATSVDAARGCAQRQYETAAADGSFSTTFAVDTNGPGGCATPGRCMIVAAERVDVAHTLVSAPIQVIAAQQANPDVQIKRRSDGTISFDNVYSIFDQHRIHAIDAGGVWVYAVRIQNDFDTTADIRLQAENALPGFRIRYFRDYAEFSDTVAGPNGFVFRDMAPGEVRLIAVQFEADADVASGTQQGVQLTLGRVTEPIGYDAMTLSVRVP